MFGFLFGLIGLIVLVELALIAVLIFVSGLRKPIADVVNANKATIQSGTRIYSIVCLLLAIAAFADMNWASTELKESRESAKSSDHAREHGLVDYYQSQRNLILSLVSPILFL